MASAKRPGSRARRKLHRYVWGLQWVRKRWEQADLKCSRDLNTKALWWSNTELVCHLPNHSNQQHQRLDTAARLPELLRCWLRCMLLDYLNHLHWFTLHVVQKIGHEVSQILLLFGGHEEHILYSWLWGLQAIGCRETYVLSPDFDSVLLRHANDEMPYAI